jgi:glycosyltransferase involved in cell wall biosynthesis
MPSVSVIVPNYNHARFLPRRMESILRQTYQDFELIVLDDCSTDDSRSILARYADEARIRFEFNTTNSGSTFKQWNKGVRLSAGNYVWIAESDDFADARVLERLVTILDADPEIAYATCRSWRVDPNDRTDGFEDAHWPFLDPERYGRDFRVSGTNECRNLFLYSNAVLNASSVVFRKGVYEAMGGADESYRMCGDWKCWTAMALRGGFAYTSEPLNYFRHHEKSMREKSAPNALDMRETYRFMRWLLTEVPMAPAEMETMRENIAGSWVPLILSMRVPLNAKKELLRQVRALDPHPLHRIPGPALWTIQRTLARRWRSMRAEPSPTASRNVY